MMKSIYSYDDYRKFTKDSFKELEGGDYGQASKLAKHLDVHTTFVSQVLSGNKFFAPEQGLRVCGFLNLNTIETEYYLLLLQLDRAATPDYRAYLQSQVRALSKDAQKLVNRVIHQKRLSKEEQATFYTDWIYSAARLSVLLGKTTIPAISKYLRIPVAIVESVTTFLVEANLLTLKNGKFGAGVMTTHLSSDSPWIKTHHRNWRMKAIESVGGNQTDLHYTAPMTLSKQDFLKVKEMLVKTINQVDQVLGPSESETLVCFNIDWFHVSPDDE